MAARGERQPIDFQRGRNVTHARVTIGGEGALLPVVRALLPAIAAALLLGCGRQSASAERGDAARGALLYKEQCLVCHGAKGEGASGPRLLGWSRGEDALVSTIDARMPLGAPERCDRDCARAIAAYILGDLRDQPLVCNDDLASPRRLRLLTRVEYRNTIRDLLGEKPATTACGTHTFTLDPAPRAPATVHVAGSFNGWAGTIGKGGYPLAKKSDGTFALTRELPIGSHQYKFVLDERDWITDPANPNRVSDGFGGQNSVLSISCGGDPFDPTVAFPVDVRPEGFAYDSAEGRVVTSTHADEYRRAASAIAKRVAIGCSDTTCVEPFLRSFGRRAFRRPLTDKELSRYRALVSGRADVASGLRAAVSAFLASPSFLYRSEMGAPSPDGAYRLTGHELATALSYGFLGTTPDDGLLDAADRGELDTAEGLERHARRLLGDPRARTVVGQFGLQWVLGTAIESANKSAAMFPDLNADLRASMAEESKRFVAHVVFDGSGKLDELFLANYTLADARLAKLYGLPAPSGSGFEKLSFTDGRRAGVLGHASFLGSAAHSDQSSPIRRGLFVRRQLLCQELPPPPPNAGGVPDVDPSATTRKRFAQHTADKFCASCHQHIDPIGFGFERFDAIGAFRVAENGQPIDAAGDMTDVEGLGQGTHAPFSSLPELAQTIAASSASRSCFVRQWFRFTRGYREGAADLCALERLRKSFDASGGDIRALMIAVVLSPDFVRRR